MLIARILYPFANVFSTSHCIPYFYKGSFAPIFLEVIVIISFIKESLIKAPIRALYKGRPAHNTDTSGPGVIELTSLAFPSH